MHSNDNAPTPTDRELLILIHDRLERLDERLYGNGQPGDVKRLDDRIATLERFRYLLLGAATTVGGAASVIARKLGI